MFKTIEGVYRDGKVKLIETPANVPEDTRVIVTFLEDTHIDLRTRGIDEAHAADLRARLAIFADDWDSPEMKVYDNYDAPKATL
ncbi:antitoxin family protein [Dehalococcoidia bacterium]|nr:antitoxin family protein [Dehalococcoidia bacterium]